LLIVAFFSFFVVQVDENGNERYVPQEHDGAGELTNKRVVLFDSEKRLFTDMKKFLETPEDVGCSPGRMCAHFELVVLRANKMLVVISKQDFNNNNSIQGYSDTMVLSLVAALMMAALSILRSCMVKLDLPLTK